ncbi:MAG: sucrase ferredoxin [Acidimicrobiales bacterium]
MIDLSVLPGPNEALRCADYTRGLALDPGGTAIHADVIIGVEIPRPWPKPVFDHPLLPGVPGLVSKASRRTRVLAAVPADSESFAIIRYERTVTGTTRQEWVGESPETLAADLLAVLSGDDPLNAAAAPESATPEVWICTQGSHDMCCGADGTRLANDAHEITPDLVIRRVSHTGGHRFAPTALTMPSGRMWAYLDPDGLAGIVSRNGDPTSLGERCRGWWGAAPGPAQVAERALLGAHGWAIDDSVRTVHAVGGGDQGDDSTAFRITIEGEFSASYLAKVRVARELPAIACRAAGGEPYKTAHEYELVSFERE